MKNPIRKALNSILRLVEILPVEEKVRTINQIRRSLAKVSPLQGEPVDCVQWVPATKVVANDYNPNSVARPEMKLLEHSISADGFTQPIVVWKTNNTYEVVDGFHRHLIGREVGQVRDRILGFLPVVVINNSRTDRGDRIASTIRHNRARGKHVVSSMSKIVTDLRKRNWSDKKIGRELGMEPDEVLRLAQIGGLAEMFRNRKFSEAWE